MGQSPTRPPGTVQFIRVFSDWERKKGKRLQAASHSLEALHPAAQQEAEASDLWAPTGSGGDWRSLVPPDVARVIDRTAPAQCDR